MSRAAGLPRLSWFAGLTWFCLLYTYDAADE